ncbi:hypothetical protein B0G71_0712 [Paraburkholderia sp. BL27I4N3]|uniref:NACHT domain-containing protein n=1 Tax=Paraburkholderia sp. BL27I4N3 TaxID=1938805 RepID=UPI000E2324BF|nr:hypothetical protein [Paraburkholderia sp. BL27I4N3]REE17747.1 hypothetical protein B0G71_0712 [Paraburkholderia sp. BL27I4N3]
MGYLADADTKWPPRFNTNLVPTRELVTKSTVTVLLGEPGSGKSFESNLLGSLAKEARNGVVLSLDLGQYGDALTLATALGRMLSRCADSDGQPLLMLDALDECRVNIKRAETVIQEALLDAANTNLRLVISCRTSAWPESLEEVLRSQWSDKNDVKVFDIAPHSREFVSARLKEYEIKPEEFFAALDTAGAHGLALHPLGLNFLLAQSKEGRAFSASRWALYENGCAALLRPSKRRLADGNLGLPDVRERMQLAGLLAAIVLLTNKTDFSTYSDTAYQSSASVGIGVDAIATFPLSRGEASWRPDRQQCLEVFESALFVTRDDDGFAFAHRTYAEFLAAHFLSSLDLSAPEAMRLLTLPGTTETLTPQLQQLAAWMTHSDRQLREFVLKADPSLLFDGSVLTDDEVAVGEIFDEIVLLAEKHKFPIYEYRLIRSYGKLAHKLLLEKLRAILLDRQRVPAVRQFASDVAAACNLVAELPELLTISLDRAENYEVRQNAANAIRNSAADEMKVGLLTLMSGENPEDIEDEMKGIALHCAIDRGMSAGSLVDVLTAEKRSMYSGAYAHALRRFENMTVCSEDVRPIIAWLRNQLGADSLEYSWDDVVFHIFSKAALAVVESNLYWSEFGEIAWLALSQHHKLSSSRSTRSFNDALGLDGLDERRQKMFVALLTSAGGDARMAASTLLHGTGLIKYEDGPFLTELYGRQPTSARAKEILAHTFTYFPTEANAFFRDWVLDVAGPHADRPDPLLRRVLGQSLEAIELQSEQAATLKRYHSMSKRNGKQPVEKQRPKSIDLLMTSLASSEGGIPGHWRNMVSHLRYADDFEGFLMPALEVTASPLWKVLDDVTRSRLVTAARAFLRHEPPVEEMLAPNVINHQEDAAVAACVLLLTTESDEDDEIDGLAVRWVRALARYNAGEQPRKSIDELLNKAMEHSLGTVSAELLEICRLNIVCPYPRMPEFAKGMRMESLTANLEALLTGLEGASFLCLVKYLIEQRSKRAVDELFGRVEHADELSSDFGASCLELIARHEPKYFVEVVWRSLSKDIKAIEALAVKYQHITASQPLPILLIDARMTEQMFELLEDRFPVSDDLEMSGFVQPRHHIQEFRTCCIVSLKEMASAESVAALERIAARHPGYSWIAYTAHQAEQKSNRDAWVPFATAELAAVMKLAVGRVIRTEAELHAVVMEELQAINDKISARGVLPAVYFLWDEKPSLPKHEPRLSDWLALELRARLSARGAVVNREVQVRSHNPKGLGERTDILIEVSTAGKRRLSDEVLQLVIEIKGCWNRELLSSPEVQLRDNYMKAMEAGHGIYLVFWFLCDRWCDSDPRKRDTQRLVPDGSVVGCLTAITQACDEASVEGAWISPVVFDCAY